MSKKETNLCAILSYLLIGIVWYFADPEMKKNKFAKFHVKQAIVLIIASLIYGFALSILAAITMFLILPLMPLLSIVPWVFMIIGIINAVNNKEKELPIIGKYAKKLTF